MSRTRRVIVTGEDGLRGVAEVGGRASGVGTSQVEMTLDSGERVLVPEDALIPQGDGTYHIPLSLTDLTRVTSRPVQEGGTTVAVPVVVEEVEVGKRRVETGRVRVTKQVSEREEIIDEPLLREEVDVRRVPVDQLVDGPLPVRQDGEVMVIPVVEEVLIIEKRFVLKEEIHIRKRRVETRDPRRVVLRSEKATVERINSQEQVAGYDESSE